LEISSAIQKVIMKGLRLDPDERFQSAIEMREALRAAINARSEAPPEKSSIRPVQLAIAAGAFTILAAVVGLYFTYLRPQQVDAEFAVESVEVVEEVLEVRAQATRVIEEGLYLEFAPADLVTRLKKKFSRAERYLEDGVADIEAGEYEIGLKNLSRGRAEYTETCQAILDSFLAAQASGRAETLLGRAAKLKSQGAEEVATKSWTALASVLPAVEANMASASGCPTTLAAISRLGSSLEGAVLANALDLELAEVWPGLLAVVYRGAGEARERAGTNASEAPEYRRAIKEAKLQMFRGSDHKSKRNDFVAARSAYIEAEDNFNRATQISRAYVAGTAARSILDRARTEEVPDLSDPISELARADEAYEGERWKSAAEQYARAEAQLEALRAANQWRLGALAIRDEAIEARVRAVGDGAENSAYSQLVIADVSMARGDAALEAGDGRAAEAAFGYGRDGYAASLSRTQRALAVALAKQVEVEAEMASLRAHGDCQSLQLPEIRKHCEDAERELVASQNAIESLDAASAMRHLALSRELFVRTTLGLELWEATQPRVPELVERIPRSEIVEVLALQHCGFGVEVSDPNGDVLRYTWSIDGEIQDEHGPVLQLRPDHDSVVMVKVVDGSGAELIEQWRVTIADAPQ